MFPVLEVKSNVREEANRLWLETREIPFVTSLALNLTARDVRQELRAEMERVFDRPTPYTLNALQITPSTKQRLTASVWFKQPASDVEEHYLEPQVFGGERPVKRFEERLRRIGVLPDGMFAVPGQAARLDKYGNISAGQIVQILSQLRAFQEAGFEAHPTGSKRSRRSVARAGTFYVARPGGHLQPGIYMRRKSKDQIFDVQAFRWVRLAPILIFVRAPRYSQRFKFFDVARRVSEERFRENFIAAARRSSVFAR